MGQESNINTLILRCLEEQCFFDINRDYHKIGKTYEWTVRVYLSPNHSNGCYKEYLLPEQLVKMDWDAFYDRAIKAATAEDAEINRRRELKNSLMGKHKDKLEAKLERERKIAEGKQLLRCLV